MDEISAKSNLQLLRESGPDIERSTHTPTPPEYWEQEDDLIAEIREQNEKLGDALKMSWEDMNKEFTI